MDLSAGRVPHEGDSAEMVADRADFLAGGGYDFIASALTAAPELRAALRLRHDRRSYLYNTDGHIYSQLGYPVLLINEHINGLENLDRAHYHELSDKSDTLNWEYGVAVTKVAIEATARLIEADGL